MAGQRGSRTGAQGGGGERVVGRGLSWERNQRVLAWRILHGKLRIGTSCPGQAGHAVSARLPVRLLQCGAEHADEILVTCPMTAAVVAWVSTTWGALTREAGPPHSADLILADDRRAWPLHGLWQ